MESILIGTLSLDYAKLVPVLISAIKQLKTEINELKKGIENGKII